MRRYANEVIDVKTSDKHLIRSMLLVLRKGVLRGYIRPSVSLALALVLELGGPIAGNAQVAVLRFNIEEMTATAERIFVGRCLAVEEIEEIIAEGLLPVTSYTFEVERAIKGRVPRQITIRQLGHLSHFAGKGGVAIHGRAASPRILLPGMPEYRVGDRLILFLIPNYLGGKVTYPVGLYQGAFFIIDSPSGQKLARNSINNLGLFTAPYNGTKMNETDATWVFPRRGMTKLSGTTGTFLRKSGALALDEFLELVEHIVAAHGDGRGAIINGKRGAIRQ